MKSQPIGIHFLGVSIPIGMYNLCVLVSKQLVLAILLLVMLEQTMRNGSLCSNVFLEVTDLFSNKIDL